MNKEKLDKLYELANVAVLINPKLIDEKAFIEEVCSILGIQPPKYLSSYLSDLSKQVVIKTYEENNIPVGNYKPLEIKYETNKEVTDNYTPPEIKHKSDSIYSDPEKWVTDEPDDCFKSTGVAEMKHIITC